MSFALEQIHTVEAEAFYFDDGVSGFGVWFGCGGIDEEGTCGAGAILDVWNLEL